MEHNKWLAGVDAWWPEVLGGGAVGGGVSRQWWAWWDWGLDEE